jgi:NADPH:quinone reductase-like Zn-dependent oxidoreductase
LTAKPHNVYFGGRLIKAVIFEKYGPPEVLKLVDIAKPTPKDNEVLIKVMATSVHTGDRKIRSASPFLARLYNGLFKPKRIRILGFEISGVVEQVGKAATKFETGDKVFAFMGFKFGGYVQYKCMDENGFVCKMPGNLSFEEAAVVPTSGLTALSFMRDNAKVKSGQNVLIYGASGSAGTYAVQLAKYYGAKVTAVVSTDKTSMAWELGADQVIDYKTQDFTDTDERYDLVFDAVNKSSKTACKKILKKTGRYISIHDSTAKVKPEGLVFLKARIEAGGIKPVVDRVYTMDEIVEAHRYVEQGHKMGNVAVKVEHDE